MRYSVNSGDEKSRRESVPDVGGGVWEVQVSAAVYGHLWSIPMSPGGHKR